MPGGLLRRNQRPLRAVHHQQFSDNFLQRAAETGFDPHLAQDARDHRFFRTQLFLLFRQVTQQQAHHQQINREHEKALGLKIRRLHSQTGQVVTRQQAVHPAKETHVKRQALQPQQGNLRGGGGNRLPHAPAVSGRSQHKNEEEKKRIGLASGENRDQRRPNDVGRVHQPAKGDS